MVSLRGTKKNKKEKVLSPHEEWNLRPQTLPTVAVCVSHMNFVMGLAHD